MSPWVRCVCVRLTYLHFTSQILSATSKICSFTNSFYKGFRIHEGTHKRVDLVCKESIAIILLYFYYFTTTLHSTADRLWGLSTIEMTKSYYPTQCGNVGYKWWESCFFQSHDQDLLVSVAGEISHQLVKITSALRKDWLWSDRGLTKVGHWKYYPTVLVEVCIRVIPRG